MVAYYRGLIALRRATPEFRLPSAAAIRQRLAFLPVVPKGVVAFLVAGDQHTLVVIYNASAHAASLTVPEGSWQVLVDERQAGVKPLRRLAGGEISVPARCAWVLRSA